MKKRSFAVLAALLALMMLTACVTGEESSGQPEQSSSSSVPETSVSEPGEQSSQQPEESSSIADEPKSKLSLRGWSEPTAEECDPWSEITEKELGAWYIEPKYDFDDVVLLDKAQIGMHQAGDYAWSYDLDTAYRRLSVFKKDGGFGVVDQSGNIIFDADFDVRSCICGLVRAGDHTLLGPRGEIADNPNGHGATLEIWYDIDRGEVCDHIGDMALKTNSLPQMTAPARVVRFSTENGAPVYENLYVFVGPDGEAISEERFLSYRSVPDSGFAPEFWGEENIFSPEYNDSELILVEAQDGGWKFIRQDGSDAGLGSFEDALPFHEGLAAVKKDGLWGYIGEDGAVVVPYRYEDAASVYDGLAWVRQNGLWGVAMIFR